LESYYRLEAPDDLIQIEIDKGAYIPRHLLRIQEVVGGV
jgi:hypothetical protein